MTTRATIENEVRKYVYGQGLPESVIIEIIDEVMFRCTNWGWDHLYELPAIADDIIDSMVTNPIPLW